jgi:hypothetical protein
MSIKLDVPNLLIDASVLKNPALFTRTSHDKEKNKSIYRLNVEMLPKEQCHMFWDSTMPAAHLISMMMEFFTFHPLSKESEKMDVSAMTCNDHFLFLCSFPIEYRDICERAAKTFRMRVKNAGIVMEGFHKDKRFHGPALTFVDDYKDRPIPLRGEIGVKKPVPKDALAIPVKRQVKTLIDFPRQENILWFDGCSLSKREIDVWGEEIYHIGNSLQKLSLD